MTDLLGALEESIKKTKAHRAHTNQGEPAMTTIDTPTPIATRLRHSDIHPDPDNVRSDDRSEVESLAQSILINGIIQPIVIDDHNIIIAGHRRYAALAMLIEQKAIPASYPIPVAYYEQIDGRVNDSTQLMLVENLQRVDLDPIEEALGYQRIVEAYGLKHQEVAERIGRSASLVSSRIRLLKLPETAQLLLKMGGIKLDVAEALIPLANYPDVIAECLNLNLSVNQIETRVNRMRRAEKLLKVKAAVEKQGATAVLDRNELAELNLGVDHQTVPIEWVNAGQLAPLITAGDTYYLTDNYREEIQIHATYEVTAEEKKSKDSPDVQAHKEKERKQKELIKIRRAMLMELINTVSLPKAEVEAMLDIVLLKSLNAAQTKFICTMLGVQKEDLPETKYSSEHQRSYDYAKALLDLLQAGGKKATRCRLAIIIGSEEAFAQSTPSKQYAELLAGFGYRVNRGGRLVQLDDDAEAEVDPETGEVLDDVEG